LNLLVGGVEPPKSGGCLRWIRQSELDDLQYRRRLKDSNWLKQGDNPKALFCITNLEALTKLPPEPSKQIKLIASLSDTPIQLRKVAHQRR
jgi:hypothetical protein